MLGLSRKALESPTFRIRNLQLTEYSMSWAISLLALCMLIVFQLVRRKVAYQFYSYDLFVVLEGILHLQHGHRPHVDFSSPVGVLYLFPYYIASAFQPLRGMVVVWGNALF